MPRYVSKEKLSKKARKAQAQQKRVTWDFNPRTRIVESKKVYNRKRIARSFREDSPGDSL